MLSFKINCSSLRLTDYGFDFVGFCFVLVSDGFNNHSKAVDAVGKFSALSPRFLATVTLNFPKRTHFRLPTCAILTNEAESPAIRVARLNSLEIPGG